MLTPEPFDALLLGPGDVAAGDDRAQQQHRGRDANGFRPRGGAGRAAASALGSPAASSARARTEIHSSEPDQDHRQAEVGGDELLGEVLLDREPAEAGLDQDQHAGGDRGAQRPAQLAQAAVGASRRAGRSAR